MVITLVGANLLAQNRGHVADSNEEALGSIVLFIARSIAQFG